MRAIAHKERRNLNALKGYNKDNKGKLDYMLVCGSKDRPLIKLMAFMLRCYKCFINRFQFKDVIRSNRC